ncbi:AAA family ATPase [Acinetobacter baumannii]
MIKSISISNFKSLKNCNLDFSDLNIISGISGSGKSSLAQAVFLIKSIQNYSDFSTISLNNEYQNLGNNNDVLYESAEKEEINININFESFNFESKLVIEDPNLDYSKFYSNIDKDFEKFKNNLSKLRILKADRSGPVLVQEKNDFYVKRGRNIGLKGEYLYSFLEEYGGHKVENVDNRIHLNAKSDNLIELANCWLSEISPDIMIETQALDGTDFVSLRYGFKHKFGRSNLYRSTNVGFGISYVLPVIILLLVSQPGDVIFLDTPEAHLHPKGQVKLGELLAKTAADGVQLIVETHSDHIINGIRKSVVLNYIEPKNIKFYYFSVSQDRSDLVYSTLIEEPKIDKEGKFDKWPDGFFDEWGKTLDHLLLHRTKDGL